MNNELKSTKQIERERQARKQFLRRERIRAYVVVFMLGNLCWFFIGMSAGRLTYAPIDVLYGAITGAAMWKICATLDWIRNDENK